eukprot:EG_transcript_40356
MSEAFSLRPNHKKKFRGPVVKEIMKKVLQEKLEGQEYQPRAGPCAKRSRQENAQPCIFLSAGSTVSASHPSEVVFHHAWPRFSARAKSCAPTRCSGENLQTMWEEQSCCWQPARQYFKSNWHIQNDSWTHHPTSPP